MTDAAFDTVPVLRRSFGDARASPERRIAPGTRDYCERQMSSRFFVYILANKPRGVVYVGVTNDLARRLSQHRAKVVRGFTERYGVTMLVHVEEYSSILEARAREHSLKRWRRAWKFELIEAINPEWRDLSQDLAF